MRTNRRVDKLMPPPRELDTHEAKRWREIAARRSGRIRVLGSPRPEVLIHDELQVRESRLLGLRRRHCEAALAARHPGAAARLIEAVDAMGRHEHVSLRCPEGLPDVVWGLQERGWRLVDTSVDYVFRGSPDQLPSPWRIDRPLASERAALSRLMGALLSDTAFIRTRFTTDPGLAPRARALYTDWAARGLVAGAGRFALAARNAAGRAIGVMTAHATRDASGAQVGRIELNAVVPEARSHGVYTALLVAMLSRLFAAGAVEVAVRTSGGTLSVQRVWQRLGGSPVRADAIFHRPVDPVTPRRATRARRRAR